MVLEQPAGTQTWVVSRRPPGCTGAPKTPRAGVPETGFAGGRVSRETGQPGPAFPALDPEWRAGARLRGASGTKGSAPRGAAWLPGARLMPRRPLLPGPTLPPSDPCERPGLKRGGDHAESGTDPSKSASRRNAAQEARPGSCRPRRGTSRGGAGLSGRGSGLGQRGVVRTPRQACARAAGAHGQRLTVRLADGASNGTLSGFG